MAVLFLTKMWLEYGKVTTPQEVQNLLTYWEEQIEEHFDELTVEFALTLSYLNKGLYQFYILVWDLKKEHANDN